MVRGLAATEQAGQSRHNIHTLGSGSEKQTKARSLYTAQYCLRHLGIIPEWGHRQSILARRAGVRGCMRAWGGGEGAVAGEAEKADHMALAGGTSGACASVLTAGVSPTGNHSVAVRLSVLT